jgi:hypothetical protein
VVGIDVAVATIVVGVAVGVGEAPPQAETKTTLR